MNDVGFRRLIVFDATLTHATVIADTTARLPYTYGLKAKPNALIPWLGDSTLFIDSDASAILVIDPQGAVANIVAAVRIADLSRVVAGAFGMPSSDGHGRLLYGVAVPFDAYAKLPDVGGPALPITFPDSSLIVRADFQRRVIDTLARLKAPVQKAALTRQANGGVMLNAAVNPLPAADDWTVLPDGTIVIVRAKDYHIDWVAPDGARRSSPSMPFDSRSISPAEKQQMVDSVKRGLDEARARQVAPGGTAASTGPTLSVIVDASDIPDSYPPIRVNQTRADYEGRVWILPATSGSARGGLLYDVVNRDGKVVERVQLPPGRALVGFGKGDVVYLGNVIGLNKAVLERTEIVR